MEMTSFSFLLYFLPVMLVVYFVLSFSTRAQNLWLVVCSLVFYTLGNYAYTLLLAGMALANFFLGLLVGRLAAREGTEKTVRWVVGITCVLNALPIFFFKHLPSLITSVSGLFGWEAITFPAVPLGVGFLALQGISYVVDIARGTVPRNPNFIDSMLYLTFFPALKAGPILRYHHLEKQLVARKVSFSRITDGACRLVVGLAKTVLLARPIMAVADIVFSQSNISGIYATVPVSLALLGLFAYGVGLYHYLSGFSDMVIGLGKVLGFTYPENFRHPQLAASVGEFWERCYSSLVGWFDDYVYQPLDKRRKNQNNDWMVLHTLLMWALIGFWLGPGLPNLIFAVWSFVFILVERIIEIDPNNTKSPLRHFFVLLFLLIALVALKTDTIYQFTLFVSNLFGMRGNGFQSALALTLLRENWPVLLAGFVAGFPIASGLRHFTKKPGSVVGGVVSVVYPVAMLALVALVVLALSRTGYNPYLMVQQYLWS